MFQRFPEEADHLERLWTKPFLLMTAGTLFLFTSYYLLLPTLPLFIKQLGGSESEVGMAVGAFMFSAVICRPVVGGLLDRFGRRPFIFWGLLLFTLAMYMYDWVGGIAVLLGIRILHGLGWAFSTTGLSTAVTDMIPSSRRGEGMGWFSTSMTLAMAVGPMFGIGLVRTGSHHLLFLVAVCLSAAALVLTLGAKMPFRLQSGTKRIRLFERSALPVAVSVFFLFISYGGITTFIPLFADSIEVNSGTFFLVYAATLVLARPVAGKISDRFGETVVVIPSLAIAALAFVDLSFSTGLSGILVSAVLYGIGFGSAQPTLQAATLRLVPPDRKGVANATFMTATDLGIGLGAIVLGWIFQYTSYQTLFIVSAVSVMISLIVFVFFVKRHRQRQNAKMGRW